MPVLSEDEAYLLCWDCLKPVELLKDHIGHKVSINENHKIVLMDE